jgi:hypothetical protein
VNWDELSGTVRTSSAAAKRSFSQFLDAHPSIRHLAIQGKISQVLDIQLTAGSLPILDCFTGIANHVTHLPSLQNMRTLRIIRPILGPHAIITHGLLNALGRMVNLSSLQLPVLLHPSLTCGKWLLQQLANACPNVEDFELACTRDKRMTFVSIYATWLKR